MKYQPCLAAIIMAVSALSSCQHQKPEENFPFEIGDAENCTGK